MLLKRENQNERELALRKYFEVPTKEDTTASIVLLIIGTALVLVGLNGYYSQRGSDSDLGGGTVVLVLLGLVLGLVGSSKWASINLRYKKALAEVLPQPADHEVDAWLQQSLQGLVVRARGALNLSQSDEVADPLMISAPSLSATYGIPSDDLKWRKGTDGRLRFALFNVMVVLFTERHLAAYTCNLNFIRNVRLNENTREYHYQDVVSVATFEWSEAFTQPTGEKLSTKQVFRLSVASGEYIEVELNTDILRKATKQEEVPVTGADKAVASIRAMIRNKKTTSPVMA